MPPAGSVNVWAVGVVPLAMISIVAPLFTGSPTTVLGDASSLPTMTMVRRAASTPGTGSFTTKDLPRIV